MMIGFLKELFHFNPMAPEDLAMDAEFELLREELSEAGLSEEALRRMDPDERVAALEEALLDPYDYLYLACDDTILCNLPS